MASDLRFIVTDKTHAYKGTIYANESTVVLLWNKAGYAEFSIDDDHRLLPALVADGARVRVLLDGVSEMSGLVEEVEGSFPTGPVKVRVFDEFLMLSYMLAWAKPTAAITAQTQEYRRYTGVSETVAKLAIAEANTRLGLGWTVAASAGKGVSTRVDARFHPLADKVIDSLSRDRLRLSVTRSTAGAVTVNVTEGAEIAKTITLESGLLAGGKWLLKTATLTRVVIGGAGQGVAREFGQYVDTALEAAIGAKREGFKDSRMSEAGADFSTDAAEAFADGRKKSSISTELNESSWFKYRAAAGYKLGDIVTIQVGPVTVTDVISTVTIEESKDEGITVTPAVGEIQDSTNKKLTAAISRLARGVRDQGRR